MSEPIRDLKFYKPKTLDKIFGLIFTDKSRSSPYKVIILDTPKFEVDNYRHKLDLKVINSRKKVIYKDLDYIVEDTNKNLSLEVIDHLWGLLDDLFEKSNKVSDKNYGLYLDGGVLYIHLR